MPTSNQLQISTDGSIIMICKQNGFISKLKEVAPHMLAIHCIIYRQHLAVKVLNVYARS